MEPVSNPLIMDSRSSNVQVYTTPPNYNNEFHQMANTTCATTTTSAMDMLCEIVNGESDISFMASVPSAHNIEKSSFLDILYYSGNEAKSAVDDEMLINEQHHKYSNNHPLNAHFSNTITTTTMHPEAGSPDLRHFKLPLLEQEPESSINNSQLDGKLKNKEIRRNLERSIVLKQGENLAQSTPLSTECVVEKAAIKQEKPETSASFNAMNDVADNAKMKKSLANIAKQADSDGVINANHVDDDVDNDDDYPPNKKLRVESSLNERVPAAETSKTAPRMTHITVERNRRKQMNEHLAILRSLMPSSYVQRGDQASIIGGVVEFIKELKQLLASLEAQKRRRSYVAEALSPRVSAGTSPRGGTLVSPRPAAGLAPLAGATQDLVATSRSPLAEVEVKLAGGAHVLLRTLSHKAARGQLLQLVAALECLSLQILHLNITTLRQTMLYTFTLKIGIECRLSVDDLADAVQQIFKDIHSRQLHEPQILNNVC